MKKGKMSLGRGLGSLLGEDAVESVEATKVRDLPIDAMEPNPHQPRQRFREESLEELARSITEQGILQPVLVRRVAEKGHGERYELVAGERRWRAARLAGLERIPALVRTLDDRQSAEIALLENVQREDLNPVEISRGYLRLMEEFAYTHEEIGRKLGVSRSAVSNALRLLRLPQEVLAWVEDEELSAGHARALLGVEHRPDLMLEGARQVLDQGLSVRETERLARRLREEAPPPRAKAGEEPPRRSSGGRRKDPTLVAMETRLAQGLHTGVSITNQKGKGRIILNYSSLEELERLSGLLLGGDAEGKGV